MESGDIWEDGLMEGFDLKSIYNQISIEDNFLFDGIADTDFVRNAIETTFDKKFLMIDSTKLSRDVTLLNYSLAQLIKFCLENKFKKVGFIFIGYCDYFDLEYNVVYKSLHEKIQNKIKAELINLIGEKRFQKINRKNNNQQFKTLFDL